eukprot:403356835
MGSTAPSIQVYAVKHLSQLGPFLSLCLLPHFSWMVQKQRKLQLLRKEEDGRQFGDNSGFVINAKGNNYVYQYPKTFVFPRQQQVINCDGEEDILIDRDYDFKDSPSSDSLKFKQNLSFEEEEDHKDNRSSFA